MFKSKGLIIVAVIILVLIGGALYLNLGKSTTTPQDAKMTEEKTQNAGEMIKGSLKSLFGTGKNVTCTVNNIENDGTGTVYVSGNKLRGDFTNSADGKTIESHFIQDEQFSYLWSSEMDQGIKMKAELGTEKSTTSDSKNAKAPSTETVDLNKEVDYKCSNWIVDNSKFIPPSDVKFSDMSDLMMPKITPSEEGIINKMEGSPCANLPDAESKAACEKALNQ
jgi:hypothetical protein